MGLQVGRVGRRVGQVGRGGSLAVNIRDLSSPWMAMVYEWEEMMCQSRVSGCAEQSLKP